MKPVVLYRIVGFAALSPFALASTSWVDFNNVTPETTSGNYTNISLSGTAVSAAGQLVQAPLVDTTSGLENGWILKLRKLNAAGSIAATGTGANYNGPYPASLAAQPATALKDSLYVNNLGELEVRISGLNPAKLYDLQIYSTRGNNAGTGHFELSAGTSASPSPLAIHSFNDKATENSAPLWNDIAPTMEGEIALKITAPGAVLNANTTGLNFLSLTEEGGGTPVLYWDGNGATAGAGGASPGGDWEGDLWSTASAGDAATSIWEPGARAVFAAGNDAVGAYTVEASGTHLIDGIHVEEGGVIVQGGTLEIGGAAVISTAGTSTLEIGSSLAGDVGITVSAAGEVVLSGSNHYTGDTRLGGAVVLKGGDAVPDGSRLELAAEASVQVVNDESAAGLAGSGALIANAHLDLGVADDAVHHGPLHGAGTVTKSGPARQTLGSAASSFSGTLNVTQGVLAPGANGGFGTSHLNLSAGASIDLTGRAAATAGIWHLAGDGDAAAASALDNSSAATQPVLPVDLVLDADTTIGGAGSIAVGTTAAPRHLTGGSFTLTKVGGGSFWFRGTASGTGPAAVIVEEGLFGVGANDDVLSNTSVTVKAGAIFSSGGSDGNLPTRQNHPVTLEGGTLAASFAGQTYTGTVTLVADSSLGSAALGNSFTIEGDLAEAGGSFGLSKVGTGTVTLQGEGSYTGPTSVQAGALRVDGTLASPVVVAAGARLSGSGTIWPPVEIENGGFLVIDHPDFATGPLTLGDSAQVRHFVDSTGGGSGTVTVSGQAVLGGSLAVFDRSAPGVPLAPGTTIPVIKASGSLSGTFDGLPEGTLLTVGVNTFRISYDTPVEGMSAVTLAVVSSTPVAPAIHIDFHAGAATAAAMNPASDPIAPGAMADPGAACWNHFVGTFQGSTVLSSVPLLLADGSASGASLSVTSGYSNNNALPWAANTKDWVAMEAWWGIRSDLGESLTIENLPPSIAGGTYRVIVYGEVGAPRTMSYTIHDVTKTITGTGAFSGGFTEGVNYVEFTGLTGSSFTLTGIATSPTVARSGINAIRILPGGGTPFGIWIGSFAGLADTTPGGDADGDGMDNFTEFAFNGHPGRGENRGRISSTTASIGEEGMIHTLTLAVRAGASFAPDGHRLVATRDGVAYVIEGSTNLVNWGEAAVIEITGADAEAIHGALTEPDSGWELRSFRLAGVPGSRGFLRAAAAPQP